MTQQHCQCDGMLRDFNVGLTRSGGVTCSGRASRPNEPLWHRPLMSLVEAAARMHRLREIRGRMFSRALSGLAARHANE